MPTDTKSKLTVENKYYLAGSVLITAAATLMVLLWYINGSGIVLVPGITAFGAELFYYRKNNRPAIFTAWILSSAAAALGILAGHLQGMHPAGSILLVLTTGFALYFLSSCTLTSLLSLSVLPLYAGIASKWYLLLSIGVNGFLCLCFSLLRRWLPDGSGTDPAITANFQDSHVSGQNSADSVSDPASEITPPPAVMHNPVAYRRAFRKHLFFHKSVSEYFLYHLSRANFLYLLIQYGICLLLLVISRAMGFPYAAAPALLMLYLSLTDRRSRMLHTPVSCALVLMMSALAGSFARMILGIRLGMPVLICVIIAYAFTCAVCFIFNLYLPAACEAAGFAWLIPQTDLMISQIQMLIGCCLFTAAAFLLCCANSRLTKKR